MRSRRPCGWCGCITSSDSGVCWSCYIVDKRAAANEAPSPNDALRGGRWVPRCGVQVWVAFEPLKDAS